MAPQPTEPRRSLRPTTARKLRPPGLPSWVIARPRLDALLQDCFNSFDVVEVAAASGAGKTVSAQLFAARFSWPTAWLNIDRADRSGTRLLVHMAQALASFDPRATSIADEALRSGLAVPEAAAVLAETITVDTLLLILDNCEEVGDDPEALAVMTALLNYLPMTTRVLLLSRAPLDAVVARIGLEGRVARVGDDELAFNPDEARLLLAAAGRPAADAAGLVDANRGWAAGIVFGADLRESRSPGDLNDYINHEILDRLALAEQRFLLKTSMLAVVTPSAARELCGPQGPGLLRQILHRRLPATVGPDGGLIYHPSFRQFLAEQLQARMPDDVGELRRRYARVLADQGDVEEAVEILLDAGDQEGAAAAANAAALSLCERADWELLIAWFERLDDLHVEAHPRLLGAKIRALAQGRRVTEAQALVRDLDARGLLAKIAEIDSGVVAHSGWAFAWRPIEGLAIMEGYPVDHRAEAVRFTLRATSGREPAAPPPGTEFGEVERFLTWGLFVQGDLDRLAEFLPAPTQWPPSGYYRSPHALLSLLWRGDLDSVHRLWDQVPLEIRHRSHTDLWHNLEAWILLDEGDSEGALHAGQEAVAHCLRTRFGWEPYFQLVVALALVRLGRLEEARPVLDDALARSRAARQQAYAEWALTYQGLLHLLLGANGPALRLLREAVNSMQAAGRRLILPGALAYLSEAEARDGATRRAEELSTLAVRSANEFGAQLPLRQALIDVPATLHRSLVEPSGQTGSLQRPPTHVATPGSATSGRRIDVHPFGDRCDIWVDGTACGVRRLKVIELAAYLALHGGTVSRQRIQLELFPEHDQRTGSNYFRQIAHQFRRATGVPLVRVDADSVGLPTDSAIISSDTSLERAVASRISQRATLDELLVLLEHTEGPYLSASSLPWVEQRRAELQVLQASVLQDCAVLALDGRRLDVAERLAECALAEDPFSEEAFRVLDAVAERSGAPERRDIVYRRAKIALAEVGIEPEEIGLNGSRGR